MMSQTLGINFYHIFKQWLGKKRGWEKYNKLNRLRMKKSFLDETKFFKVYYLLIKKNSRQSLMIAWANCKKGVNLISSLVLQNEHAMFVW